MDSSTLDLILERKWPEFIQNATNIFKLETEAMTHCSVVQNAMYQFLIFLNFFFFLILFYCVVYVG
jgi:hypothetical protein